MLGPRRLPAPRWLRNMDSRLLRFHQLRRESAQEWSPGGLRTMSHDPKAHRWLLEWSDDSGDPDHDIRATADTVEEARAAMDRILTGVTWTPADARKFGGDQTEPAYTALVREAFHGARGTALFPLASESISSHCD